MTLPVPGEGRYPVNLFMVRHGHTPATEQAIAAGRTDVPLSDTGRGAIMALGARMASLLPAANSSAAPTWVASPLRRTRDSAALLQQSMGIDAPIGLDERLVELDFGDWEGLAWADIHRNHGAAMAHWAEDWVRRAPPGGESFTQQQVRCAAWLHHYLQARSVPDTGILVAHGGTLRALLCTLLDWPASQAMRFSVDPACVFQCRYDPASALWRAVWFNEPGGASTSATRSSSQ